MFVLPHSSRVLGDMGRPRCRRPAGPDPQVRRAARRLPSRDGAGCPELAIGSQGPGKSRVTAVETVVVAACVVLVTSFAAWSTVATAVGTTVAADCTVASTTAVTGATTGATTGSSGVAGMAGGGTEAVGVTAAAAPAALDTTAVPGAAGTAIRAGGASVGAAGFSTTDDAGSTLPGLCDRTAVRAGCTARVCTTTGTAAADAAEAATGTGRA
jgi:hypothetical protein